MDSQTTSGQFDQPRFECSLNLGVLLVHGFGEQRRGDTLVSWLDTIVATINAATQNRFCAVVEWADLGNRTGGHPPAHAVVRIQGDGVDESWLVAEALWAETFMAPSFARLVTWSFRAIPWTIAMHVAQKSRRRAEQGERIRWVLSWVWTVAQLLVTLFLAPFIVVGLALLLFIGLIPIDAISAQGWERFNALWLRQRATAWYSLRAQPPRLPYARRSLPLSHGFVEFAILWRAIAL